MSGFAIGLLRYHPAHDVNCIIALFLFLQHHVKLYIFSCPRKEQTSALRFQRTWWADVHECTSMRATALGGPG